jgi:hypothetical protein
VRDTHWRPWDKRKKCSAHEKFTPEEEAKIAQRIRDEIATPGTLFTDSDFRALAMEEFLARYWREDEDWRRISFQDSHGFIAGFNKRNGISSRRAYCRRRPAVDPDSMAAWQHEIEMLLATVGHDQIFNVDQT